MLNSIILKDPKEGKIYKYNHLEAQRTAALCVSQRLVLHNEKMQNPKDQFTQLLAIGEERMIFGLMFWVFPLITPPLSDRSALRCLGPLIQSTAKAIESLHKLGFAHLDIRLDNICFHSGNPVLIDFDFAKFVGIEVPQSIFHRNEVSCLYKCRGSVKTCAQCDWMQLGWMGFWLHNRKSLDSEGVIYHRMDCAWDKLVTCDFLKKAVNEGSYSEDSLLSSPLYVEHQESIVDVLRTNEDS